MQTDTHKTFRQAGRQTSEAERFRWLTIALPKRHDGVVISEPAVTGQGVALVVVRGGEDDVVQQPVTLHALCHLEKRKSVMLLTHTLNSITFDYYTKRQCRMRSLLALLWTDAAGNWTPGPLNQREVTGFDTFTNYSTRPHSALLIRQFWYQLGILYIIFSLLPYCCDTEKGITHPDYW